MKTKALQYVKNYIKEAIEKLNVIKYPATIFKFTRGEFERVNDEINKLDFFKALLSFLIYNKFTYGYYWLNTDCKDDVYLFLGLPEFVNELTRSLSCNSELSFVIKHINGENLDEFLKNEVYVGFEPLVIPLHSISLISRHFNELLTFYGILMNYANSLYLNNKLNQDSHLMVINKIQAFMNMINSRYNGLKAAYAA